MAIADTGEPPALSADVIVVTDRITTSVLSWLQRALECSGPILNKLIVIAGPFRDPDLEGLLPGDPRVTLLPQTDHPDDALACNRGLAQRAGDVALLPLMANVTRGWLSELAAAAHSEERTAFAWPLSSADFGSAQPATNDEHYPAADEATIALQATSGLPRWTTTSSIRGDCVYVRGQVLDAIGLLDTGFSSCQPAIMDWVMRAQALGFFGKRANHVFVDHVRSDIGAGQTRFLNFSDQAVLEKRHPHFAHQAATFEQSLDGRLAQHAIEFLKTGKLRVAYDIRHVPSRNDREHTRAIELADELSRIPQIELSILVDTPSQAAGLNARILTGEEWCDDFAVIHKPAQFLNRRELEIPFGSSSHVVITYQDSTARRDPTDFGDDTDFDASDTTSALSLLCASGILVDSPSSREEIASELGIPCEEIAVAPMARMAQSTFDLYRSAVLRPTERSLQMRRLMREAILSWSRPFSGRSLFREEHDARIADPAMGVRAAWKSLNTAVGRRVGREARRFHSRIARSRA